MIKYVLFLSVIGALLWSVFNLIPEAAPDFPNQETKTEMAVSVQQWGYYPKEVFVSNFHEDARAEQQIAAFNQIPNEYWEGQPMKVTFTVQDISTPLVSPDWINFSKNSVRVNPGKFGVTNVILEAPEVIPELPDEWSFRVRLTNASKKGIGIDYTCKWFVEMR